MFKTLTPPEMLCITDSTYREDSLCYIRDIIDSLHTKRLAVHIDLSQIKYASAAASVLLFAVLNRAYFVIGQRLRVRFTFPKKETNPQGHRCIVRTGLARALVANTHEKLDALVQQERYFQSS
ncbi:MAG: hypothetical protein E7G69_18555, partial [Enterobacter sp.]|nr:hypothetical protein [Enterobacter sp.]